MREIFNNLPKINIDVEKNLVFLDTCFFIHTFEKRKEEKLKELMTLKKVAMTSFNVDEFLLKEHSVDERIRENARKLLKKYPLINIAPINVFPGDKLMEKEFVSSIDKTLLKEIVDPSDAVLIATAIKTKSCVLTKDKHHLFTTKLENYLEKYNIKVFKEYHEILN